MALSHFESEWFTLSMRTCRWNEKSMQHMSPNQCIHYVLINMLLSFGSCCLCTSSSRIINWVTRSKDIGQLSAFLLILTPKRIDWLFLETFNWVILIGRSPLDALEKQRSLLDLDQVVSSSAFSNSSFEHWWQSNFVECCLFGAFTHWRLQTEDSSGDTRLSPLMGPMALSW